MKIKNSKYIVFIALTIALTIMASPLSVYCANAVSDSKTVITLIPGVSSIDVNGTKVNSERPYLKEKILYVPLRAVLEAIGADVIWKGNGEINLIYRDASVDIAIGATAFTENQVKRTMPVPPVYKNKSVMVPANLIKECFDVDVYTNSATGKTSITLKNDGALIDLSFLTGSISKPSAGNSYFGWSLSIPKGSRVAAKSFNSREIDIENENHGIDIYVSAELKNQKTLEDYYKEIKDDPYTFLGAELLNSSLNENASRQFIELLYSDSYDEAVYHRIYAGDKYFYNIIVTSYNESDPSILKNDKSVIALMDSFKSTFKNDSSDTEDVSNIRFGLAEYENYIASDSTSKKYYSWGMSVIPEWDVMSNPANNPYSAQLGTGKDEYISVEIASAKDINNIAKYGDSVKTSYNSNFNPSLFSIINSDSSSISGKEAYQMIYQATFGKTNYKYDERFFISDGLLYDITLKTPAVTFEKASDSFDKMLKTFNTYSKDSENLLSEIQRYNFNADKNRLGKDTGAVVYENKNFAWTIKMPGNWQKNSAPGLSLESLSEPASGAVVMVEAKPEKDTIKDVSDQDRFDSMNLVASMGLEPVKTEIIQLGGRNAKLYKYRIDDDVSGRYADVYYYIINGDTNSYCIMTSVPDITSSVFNNESIKNIIDSFSIN